MNYLPLDVAPQPTENLPLVLIGVLALIVVFGLVFLLRYLRSRKR